MNAVTIPDANPALFRCVQDWHPEERLWLEQYVAVVKERVVGYFAGESVGNRRGSSIRAGTVSRLAKPVEDRSERAVMLVLRIDVGNAGPCVHPAVRLRTQILNHRDHRRLSHESSVDNGRNQVADRCQPSRLTFFVGHSVFPFPLSLPSNVCAASGVIGWDPRREAARWRTPRARRSLSV